MPPNMEKDCFRDVGHVIPDPLQTARDEGQVPCGHVLDLVRARSSEIDRTIDELRVLQHELARLVERAERLDPADCDPRRVCHLIGDAG